MTILQYTVDLSMPAKHRWTNILSNHKEQANQLLNTALFELEQYTGNWTDVLKRGLHLGYKLSGGYYQEDMTVWATALNRPVRDIVAANVSYELGQAGSRIDAFKALFSKAPGCTAAAIPINGRYLHLRNLDWELPGMNSSTICIDFVNDDRTVRVVTNPGLVGVLSGMVPGEFSVTLNWAPPTKLPRFNFGPVFLIRRVLETARDFKEAVAILSQTPLSSAAFFMVTGPMNACIIERTQSDWAIQWADGKPLVITNHYLCDKFKSLNQQSTEKFGFSSERLQCAHKVISAFKPKAELSHDALLNQTLDLFKSAPVFNEKTMQQMIFDVTSRQLLVGEIQI